MNPITHALVSWALANTARLERRDRALVTLAGVAPDIDGIGIVAEALTKESAHPLLWFSQYHHVVAHNLGGALVATAVVAVAGKRRLVAAGLACASFHLHLLCDLIGARGPDGDQWPIPYLSPFSKSLELTWSGQWALNAWPNFVITGVFLVFAFGLAWKHGRSPLEIVSPRVDAAFVAALRARFGSPRSADVSPLADPGKNP